MPPRHLAQHKLTSGSTLKEGSPSTACSKWYLAPIAHPSVPMPYTMFRQPGAPSTICCVEPTPL
jgi:hypothetical protein